MSERARPTSRLHPSATSAVVCAVLALFLLGACADAVDVAQDSTIEAASATGAPDGDGGGKDGPGADGEGRADASPQGVDGGPKVRLRLPNSGPPKPVFLTPSRNIGCAISTDSVRCDIIERSYDLPEKPADCDGDFGQSISVGRDGIATFVCVTDTVVDPGAPVLPYGTSTEVGDFGCISSEAHIACYHLGSEHGFELSRESPALF